ncbi:MAG: PKD domain-containing protein [Bacteroidetes bacterium]|nr:PKD domain-containing protein [Bacteroidota bacterium]
MKKNKLVILFFIITLNTFKVSAQIDTSFWFAAPWVTPDHFWKDDIKFHFAGQPGTVVRFRQPALSGPSQYDTTFVLDFTGTFDYMLWKNKLATPTSLGYDFWESRPANTVLPYGLYISAALNPTVPANTNPNITVVYDVITRASGFLNPETFSLKGQNGFGKDFFCPFQTRWRNQNFTGTACGSNAQDLNCDGILTQPKQQINIVATKPNTTVWILPKTNVVGHPANTTYSIMLVNAGDVYTIENMVQNTNVIGNNLSGTAISSDKDICVTVADDSVSGVTGCFDLMGDQIVPVEITGTDYILNKGFMAAAEHEGAYVVATDNFTQLTINDGVVTNTLMNKGDTYHYKTTQPLTYINANKKVYCLHASGTGCELGEAILPPLSCAGSSLVAFSRTNNQGFYVNLLCKNGAQNSFTLTNSTGTLSIPVPGGAFTQVPGTSTLIGGPFWGAQLNLSSLATCPIGTYTILNTYTTTLFPSPNDFALGIFGGNGNTGGLFHYMSSFLRKVQVVTQPTVQVCAGTPSVMLTGTVTGGAITGLWSTTGTGTFAPAYTSTLNTVSVPYFFSSGDELSNNINFTLTSVGSCEPVSNTATVVINKKPVVSITSTIAPVCKNNVTFLNLTGAVLPGTALSANWTGGSGGIYGVPGPITTYTPSSADITAGTINFTLTSSGPNPGCVNTFTNFTVTFINPPQITASNTFACTNQSVITLSASAVGSTMAPTWNTGNGTGLFFPTNQTLVPTYQFSTSDYTLSNIIYTVTLPGQAGCAPVSTTISVNIIPQPNILTSTSGTICSTSTLVSLSGTISGGLSGTWSTYNGTGAFTQIPQSNASYTLSTNDQNLNEIKFYLTSIGGICPPSKSDTIRVNISQTPIVQITSTTTAVCRNAPIPLTGTISGNFNSFSWSAPFTSSPGTFTPNVVSLNTQYFPSPANLSAGSVIIRLEALSNNCPPNSQTIAVTFVDSPEALFSISAKKCVNDPVLFTNNSLANGTSSLSYGWNFGFSPTSVSSFSNPIYTYTNTGSYVITLTVSGTNGSGVRCSDTTSKRITVNSLPIPNFSLKNACQDLAASFSDSSFVTPGNITGWLWQFGNAAGGTSTIKNPTYSYSLANTYNVQLTATTNNSCTASITKLITINPKPNAEFGMTNNPTVAQEPVYFSDFSTPTNAVNGWSWNFGDESGSSLNQNPTHSYQEPGSFVITLTVYDQNGCSDTTSKRIEVNLLPQVPTAFSPNNDNNNDLLFVKGGPFEKMTFKVYNNWGELLFETTDQKKGWDGTKNGEPQPVGVYVWTLETSMYNNRVIKKHGDITIIR